MMNFLVNDGRRRPESATSTASLLAPDWAQSLFRDAHFTAVTATTSAAPPDGWRRAGREGAASRPPLLAVGTTQRTEEEAWSSPT